MLNCRTPHDTVSDALDKLHRQLTRHLDQLITLYGSDASDTLLAPISEYPNTWMMQTPYNSLTFEFEWATFTLAGLCNMVELLHGTLSESEFLDELTQQMREHIIKRLAYHEDVAAREAQERLNAELTAAVEGGEAA